MDRQHLVSGERLIFQRTAAPQHQDGTDEETHNIIRHAAPLRGLVCASLAVFWTCGHEHLGCEGLAVAKCVYMLQERTGPSLKPWRLLTAGAVVLEERHGVDGGSVKAL